MRIGGLAIVAVAAGILAVAATCSSTTAFVCDADSQCSEGGVAGRCEPGGFCSVPDDGCVSGRRFGNSAGSVAGVCIPPSTLDPMGTSGTTGVGDTSGADAGSGTTGGVEPEPSCGDGITQAGEECDEGSANGSGGPCKDDCTLNSCGDSYVGPGEVCDDGNQIDDDRCRNNCAPASCGDGTIQPPEECDDANADNTDDCLDSCANASCGDGFAWVAVEECDDGNGVDNDDCLNSCVAASCGDLVIWEGVEQCDDGNSDDTDACVSCRNADCGDGAVWAGVEDCEPSVFNGASCESIDDRWGGGSLICDDECVFVTTGCCLELGQFCGDGNPCCSQRCVPLGSESVCAAQAGG